MRWTVEEVAHALGVSLNQVRFVSAYSGGGFGGKGAMVAEIIGGLLSGSLALMADAGHMLTDTLALVIALTALTLASKSPDDRRTYGYKRIEVLAAFLNGN